MIGGMGLRQAVRRRLAWGGGAAVVVWLLVLAVVRGWDAADPVASVVGATAAVLALVYAAVAPPDAEQLAVQLAREVVRVEQREYVRWLDGDTGGRIDLGFTARVHGRIEGVLLEGRLGGLATYFRGLRPGRMVITGTDQSDDAGTGKSLAALSLVLEIARDRAPGEAVPLRMSATAWRGQAVDEWMQQHLMKSFGLRSGSARLLVEAHLVMPVIDGLDELDRHDAPAHGSRAAELLRQLNSWQHGAAPASAVVTCRRPTYDSLTEAEAHVRTAAVVCLGPVNGRQARDFLRWRVADTEAGLRRWLPVMDRLAPSENRDAGVPSVSRPDGDYVLVSPAATRLRAVLATPWRLSLAATVYQERSPSGRYRRHPSQLVDLAEAGTLHRYLLDRFLSAALATQGNEAPQAATAWRRLAVLAGFLQANRGSRVAEGRKLSSTDLVLPELWPIVGAERMKRAIRLAGYAVAGANEILLVIYAAATNQWPLLVLSISPLMGLAFSSAADLWEGDDRIRLRPGRYALGLALGATPFTVLGIFVPSSDPWFTWAGIAMVFGLMAGGVMGLMVVPDERRGGPLGVVRSDAVGWLLVCLNFVVIFAVLGFGSNGWQSGLIAVYVLVAFFGSLTLATLSLRYLTFLVLMRGVLPWRLGRFLHSCHQAGILRTAGPAYQFRHRELQDHLAVHPNPAVLGESPHASDR